MTPVESRIAENYDGILKRIEAACLRSGRPGSSVKLIAVTKYAEIDWMHALLSLGQSDLGESRPQQLVERAPLFHNDDVEWHLIGHLQRNKVRPVLPLASSIHSIDTFRLLTRVDHLTMELGLRTHVLLEVNVSGETAKDGFATDDLLANWNSVLAMKNVHIDGLMTMARHSDNPEEARPTFQALRTLRDELNGMSPALLRLSQLSMGMSGDFEVAIEEGATVVRIGSKLFEGLKRPA